MSLPPPFKTKRRRSKAGREDNVAGSAETAGQCKTRESRSYLRLRPKLRRPALPKPFPTRMLPLLRGGRTDRTRRPRNATPMRGGSHDRVRRLGGCTSRPRMSDRNHLLLHPWSRSACLRFPPLGLDGNLPPWRGGRHLGGSGGPRLLGCGEGGNAPLGERPLLVFVALFPVLARALAGRPWPPCEKEKQKYYKSAGFCEPLRGLATLHSCATY